MTAQGIPLVNLRQTAEVAVLVATSAAPFVEGPGPIPPESLHGYWKQSRTRLKCWFAGLQAVRLQGRAGVSQYNSQARETLIGLCREILVTEMLTRVWSTVLTASDRRRGTRDTRSAVEVVFRGHLEARCAVLGYLTDPGPLSSDDQIALDRFRRRIERWTDALLGPLMTAWSVPEFVFDEQRARDFAEHSLQESLRTAAEKAIPLLMAGVAAAIPDSCDADRERASLNRAVVRSILAAFPPGALGNDAPLSALALTRIQQPDRPGEAHPDSRRAGLSFTQLRKREQQGGPSAD
jgi:hypothetical protein